MTIPNDPPFSPDNIAAQMQWYMENGGPNCAKNEDLDYLGHINTPNDARDLDLVRNLTGYREMDCWGRDAGATLAATYAAMFPDQVGRIVLDGIFNIK
jgi:pimeloyl-ACP methyl ester carboxylesterase